ncbi:MAG: hypothetical protein HN778_07215 [Prolixibacteraceae bacterium]|jgi:hypothetical protein|nr:hypothetical protein [Prolixibacteraceae bacterium]MBT6007496.1 hypothetical protein [Prolixibacteraceae bacterium]MBT6763997.1 hypothetical protein [Prolixibacteraceae bacterium]MBT6997498.1 hypothetical protein [Prolixibacteraceae bacterium]MBT7394608.1 hypothetical protein [Prolixibacteraceae bacterium]
MKKIIILLIWILTFLFAEAQEGGEVVQILKGKVINELTNEPVSYTNIGLEDTFFGTASDVDGNFELKIPAELVSKDIYFSAVGFKNKKFPVKTLFSKEFNIVKLDAQSYGIDDIDIAAQSKVLIRILRMASENIPINFISGPFNLACNYENEKLIDDSIQITQNASVLIYDKTGYTNPSKLNAFHSRKYSVKKEGESAGDYRFSTGSTNMDELLELDWVRSGSSLLNPALLPELQLALDDEPIIDGSPAWLISFKQKVPTLASSGDFYATSFEGKITIDKDDYSVKEIEGKVVSAKNNRQGKSLAIGNSNSNFIEDVSYNFKVKYSNLKPDFILLNKKYLSNGNMITEQSRLVIQQIQTTNLSILKSRDYFTGG